MSIDETAYTFFGLSPVKQEPQRRAHKYVSCTCDGERKERSDDLVDFLAVVEALCRHRKQTGH